tara:strand:+ start:3690 stop:4151 length:462 start_codon:yes stop_codon:yes gene_type:complete
MIAETMAGIALVKASVDGIKKAITTCNDIGDIAKYIDGMFEGEQQIQKIRSKAQKDPFAVNTIAEETINAKLAQEHMQEMKNLINMRFGPGIWEGIIAERAKRIQQAKEAEKQARIAKRKKHEALVHNLEITTIVVVCSCIAVAALIGLILLV